MDACPSSQQRQSGLASDRIYRGDCLDLLPKITRDHGPFQLIYTDPPFNAGGTRRVRDQKGDRTAGTQVYKDHWGGLDNFLEMLAPRLKLMAEALDPSGSLWVHLDYRTVHDTKVLLDKIFGRSACAGEIIWVPGNGGKSRRGPSVTHQTLLVYRKGKQMIWNGEEPALREPFAATSLRMHFRQQDAAGRHYRERTVGGKTYRYYADEGRRIGSVWTDCPAMNANTPLTGETTGYPTQKPEKLLERIILASSHPGGAVLDPMCGSGTTPAVATRLGRSAWACDLSDVACQIARGRMVAADAARASKGESPLAGGPAPSPATGCAEAEDS